MAQRESPPVASRTRSRTTVAPVVNVAAERTFILSSIQSFAAVRLNKFLVLRPVRHDPVLAAHTLATWEELMSQMWHDILHQQRSPKFTLNLLQDRNAALHRNYAVCRAFFQAPRRAVRESASGADPPPAALPTSLHGGVVRASGSPRPQSAANRRPPPLPHPPTRPPARPPIFPPRRGRAAGRPGDGGRRPDARARGPLRRGRACVRAFAKENSTPSI